MKIPNTNEHLRYYVALDEDEAYSSYSSYEEAKECIEKFKLYNMDYINNVAGIIEVGTTYKVWVMIMGSCSRTRECLP